MGERYWITGVQLGILAEARYKDRHELVAEITDKQFITNCETDEDKAKFAKQLEALDGKEEKK